MPLTEYTPKSVRELTWNPEFCRWQLVMWDDAVTLAERFSFVIAKKGQFRVKLFFDVSDSQPTITYPRGISARTEVMFYMISCGMEVNASIEKVVDFINAVAIPKWRRRRPEDNDSPR